MVVALRLLAGPPPSHYMILELTFVLSTKAREKQPCVDEVIKLRTFSEEFASLSGL
jgi:hypothetical protein